MVARQRQSWRVPVSDDDDDDDDDVVVSHRRRQILPQVADVSPCTLSLPSRVFLKKNWTMRRWGEDGAEDTECVNEWECECVLDVWALVEAG